MSRSFEPASIELTDHGAALSLKGNWLVDEVSNAETNIQQLSFENLSIKTINASDIAHMDTAGAFLLFSIREKCLQKNPEVKIIGLQENFQALMQLVSTELKEIHTKSIAIIHHPMLYRIGEKAVDVFQQATAMMSFLGEVFVLFLQ